MIAYCGLDCEHCPAYEATQAGDMEALAKVAEGWSKQFGMEIPTDSIVCDGCKSDSGRINAFCSMCQAKSCAAGKGIATCAHCPEFACKILEACPGYMAEGREALERIRRELD